MGSEEHGLVVSNYFFPPNFWFNNSRNNRIFYASSEVEDYKHWVDFNSWWIDPNYWRCIILCWVYNKSYYHYIHAI